MKIKHRDTANNITMRLTNYNINYMNNMASISKITLDDCAKQHLWASCKM